MPQNIQDKTTGFLQMAAAVVCLLAAWSSATVKPLPCWPQTKNRTVLPSFSVPSGCHNLSFSETSLSNCCTGVEA